MRVLVTRPDGEATRAALEARGHRVTLEPLLRIVAREGAPPPGPFEGVIATSAKAFLTPIPALAADLAANLAADLAANLAVVGARTAEAAQVAGWPAPAIVAPDAAALVAALRQAWPSPRRVLYLAGLHRSTDLAAELRELRHDVAIHLAYEAVAVERLSRATRQALASGGIDAVLHYSRRTAETFVAACGSSGGVAGPRHICLSALVAETLREAGALRVGVAATPNEPSLFAALEDTGQDAIGWAR